ncbi:MAG: CDP-diacylglycerol--glycerol-3-phosphate 3-phosphatidyltransferase [bacterium]|nr:CDP-diacylglycerol--glycerol-3-phosphate 3-phosphatidyltransferase [bacterium]
MNLPNRLTILRLILTPIFLALIVMDLKYSYLAALIVFVIASLTDMVDGMVARKNNLITDFGKFLDPLADKMLTTAAFLAFIKMNLGVGIVWITFIVLIREFLITSLRLISAGKGKVIAANAWGKAKTISQMVAIISVIFFEQIIKLFELPQMFKTVVMWGQSIVLWVSAVLTVISGIIYVIDNRKFIDPSK